MKSQEGKTKIIKGELVETTASPQNLKELNATHYRAILLKFQGKPYKEIADKLYIKHQTVQKWFTDPLIKREYDLLVQEEIENAKGRLSELTSTAVKKIESLLNHDNPQVVLRALDIWNKMTGQYNVGVVVQKEEKLHTLLEGMSDEELEKSKEKVRTLMDEKNKMTLELTQKTTQKIHA